MPWGYAMHFGHLALFHAVATTGSVTRGAERAMVSQPAVSRQLRALERTLGATLFDRGPRGVTLTEAGRTLATYAARIFELADEAERAIRDGDFVERGRVAIGASPTVGTYALPAALVHMRRRFPRVEVRVEIASPRRLAVAIDAGEVDVAVSDVPLPTRDAEQRAIGTERLVVIAPPGRGRRAMRVDDLAGLPFIAHEAGDPTRAFVEAELARHGVAPRVELSLASTEAIKRAVAGGLGVAIVPEMAVADDVKRRSLSIVRVAGLALQRPIVATLPARRASTTRREPKAATAFLMILRHALRGTLPALPAAAVAIPGAVRDRPPRRNPR